MAGVVGLGRRCIPVGLGRPGLFLSSIKRLRSWSRSFDSKSASPVGLGPSGLPDLSGPPVGLGVRGGPVGLGPRSGPVGLGWRCLPPCLFSMSAGGIGLGLRRSPNGLSPLPIKRLRVSPNSLRSAVSSPLGPSGPPLRFSRSLSSAIAGVVGLGGRGPPVGRGGLLFDLSLLSLSLNNLSSDFSSLAI